nr:hypothetical protein [Tanacetum cinerariifolium]
MFYQNRPFVAPYNNQNASYNSPTGLYRPTMESSTSSQPYQQYSPINPTNLDLNFEDLMFSQEYNYSQDYSMGHGLGHGSAHGSVLIHDEEDDSPVEETSPVKPKKPSRREIKAKKDEPKEVKDALKEWTVEEEIAFCQGWCDVSENNISGNSMKAKEFWETVIRYFEKETGSSRGWKDVEMLYFYQTQGRKKSKTSETTSRSASGGLNLNEKANEARKQPVPLVGDLLHSLIW